MGKNDLDSALAPWAVNSKVFVTYGGQCVNPPPSLFLPFPLSNLLHSFSPPLPQTLQEQDPNKAEGKQFSHHKPYYSVHPGVLPCQFI